MGTKSHKTPHFTPHGFHWKFVNFNFQEFLLYFSSLLSLECFLRTGMLHCNEYRARMMFWLEGFILFFKKFVWCKTASLTLRSPRLQNLQSALRSSLCVSISYQVLYILVCSTLFRANVISSLKPVMVVHPWYLAFNHIETQSITECNFFFVHLFLKIKKNFLIVCLFLNYENMMTRLQRLGKYRTKLHIWFFI